MKKILFPTDFSEAAHKAFKYALEIAKKANSKLDVIHIYPEPHKGKELYMDPHELRQAHKDFRASMEAKMESFLEPYDTTLIGSKIVFPSDFTANKVIERSKKHYDLIIMGTKGERNALNKIVGSFTTKTMMNSHCPVLAVPNDCEFKSIEKITYATALNEKDEDFTKPLSKFADLFGASIEYLHIIEESNEKVENHLKARGLSSADPNVHLVENESIMNGIESFLKDNETNILALFIPKRSFIDRIFRRSMVKELTFHASLPMFVMKEK